MIADPAAQQRLLNLADLDAELGKLQHTARSLPQHEQIAAGMTERQQVSDNLVAAETRVSDLQIAVQRAEGDLVPVRSRLERDQARIDDGSVTDGKTLNGLIDEVAHLKRRIDELEDVELEVMGELEEATAEQQRLSQQKQETETRLRELVATRDEQVGKLGAEAKDLNATRARMIDGIPENLMVLYEKLRASTGLGAARLERGRCTGCQLQLTAADLDAYRKAPANEVLRCVECDRILVRTAVS